MQNFNNVLNDCLPFMPIELNQIISEYAYNPYDDVIKQLKTTKLKLHTVFCFNPIKDLEIIDNQATKLRLFNAVEEIHNNIYTDMFYNIDNSYTRYVKRIRVQHQ